MMARRQKTYRMIKENNLCTIYYARHSIRRGQLNPLPEDTRALVGGTEGSQFEPVFLLGRNLARKEAPTI